MSEVAPDSWQDALTRRLRTLVRLSPLHRLEAAKAHRGEHLGGIDTRALALRALDLAIERMGLGGGMTHDELTEELLPLIARMSPQLDPPDRLAVAVAVLHGLLNERERRREFQEPYVAFEGPLVARRTIDFRLLRETETADGAIVLRATTEAINIYAGMLEYPVEDAQIAEESVLKAQLSRGQIADAVRTAQRARVRSIEYEQKIQGILDTVRRDIKQVDWIRDVLALLDAARLHLADRQEHERELLALIDARLDLAIGELAAQLAALRDAVDECYRRHMQLHRRLIPANQEYLREQDRQVFRPRLAAALPDLEGAVLRPALALPTGQLAALTDALLARFLPPRPPPLLRLTNLIDRLLAPRRGVDDAPADLEQAVLEDIDVDRGHFSGEDQLAVDDLLAELQASDQPIRLSAWIPELRRRGHPQRTLHYLVLRLLAAYGSDHDPLADRLEITPIAEALDDPDFFGDDLHLRAHAVALPKVGT
jgi:hypothetical protein